MFSVLKPFLFRNSDLFVLVVNCVYHICPRTLLTVNALRNAITLTSINTGQVFGSNDIKQLFGG